MSKQDLQLEGKNVLEDIKCQQEQEKQIKERLAELQQYDPNATIEDAKRSLKDGEPTEDDARDGYVGKYW